MTSEDRYEQFVLAVDGASVFAGAERWQVYVAHASESGKYWVIDLIVTGSQTFEMTIRVEPVRSSRRLAVQVLRWVRHVVSSAEMSPIRH